MNLTGFAPTTRPSWTICALLQAVEEGGAKTGGIFTGIAIFVNGWTRPSADELKRLMLEHGGVFHHYRNPSTTHIIASNLPDVKVKSGLQTGG